MADNRSEEAYVEGTRFYKQNPLRGATRIAVLIAVGIVVVAAFLAWAVIDVGARRAYKEARDVRRALRTVGTEYYSSLTSIYDPSSPDGLADGASEKIEQVSTRDGEVILYAWDDTYNVPMQFEYRKGLYRVVYIDSGNTSEVAAEVRGDFHVYYSLELFHFEAE